MQMNEVECGVEYVRNGKTLSFVGEWEEGEVHLNDAFVGFYFRDEDEGTVQIISEKSKLIASFEDSEEGYAAYAQKMLA